MHCSRCSVACFAIALLLMPRGLVWAADEPIAYRNRAENFFSTRCWSTVCGTPRSNCANHANGRTCFSSTHPGKGSSAPTPPSFATAKRCGCTTAAGPQGIREDGTNAEVTCYAESVDGIHWTKPKLGLFEVAGSKENNVVLAGMAPSSHNFTPLLDTRPGVPPDERYKALANGKPFGDFNLTLSCLRFPRRHPLAKAARGARNGPDVCRRRLGVRLAERRFLVPVGANVRLLFSQGDQQPADSIADNLEGLSFIGRPLSRCATATPARPRPRISSIRIKLSPISALRTSTWQPPRVSCQGEKSSPMRRPRQIGAHPEYYNDTSDAVLMSTRGGTQYDCMFSRGVSQARHRDAELGVADELSGAERRADRADRNVLVRAGRLRSEIGPSAPVFAPLGWILVAAGAPLGRRTGDQAPDLHGQQAAAELRHIGGRRHPRRNSGRRRPTRSPAIRSTMPAS